MATKKALAILGLAYVGLASAAIFLERGYQVSCFDLDEEKVLALSEGTYHNLEEKVGEILYKRRKQITYYSSIGKLPLLNTYVVSLEGSRVEEALQAILKNRDKNEAIRILLRSSVEIGYANKLQDEYRENPFVHFISYPAFLEEGKAYLEEKDPMRVVIGAAYEEDFSFMRKFRADLILKGVPFYEMSNVSAELTKCASNAFLATKVSFANSLSRLSDKLGANIKDVTMAMGADPRIGRSMLSISAGYGDNALSKDLSLLLEKAKSLQTPLPIVEGAVEVNISQPEYVLSLLEEAIGSLEGKRVTVLGLSYKEGVGDIKGSPALRILSLLNAKKTVVKAYDPITQARKQIEALLPEISVANSLKDALEGADILVLLKADPSFASIKENYRLMEGRVILDARDQFPLDSFPYCTYISLGRKTVLPKDK